jgi:hypothetical protein
MDEDDRAKRLRHWAPPIYGRVAISISRMSIRAGLLVDLGVDADDAIVRVRSARPGAIETPEQEAFVRRYGRRS